MNSVILRSKPFLTGVTFLLIGLGALLIDSRYKIGSATNMQPGFFPGILAILLIVIGAASIGVSLRAGIADVVIWPDVRPIVFLMVGMIAFALTLERIGLVPAIFLLVLISCYNRLLSHWLEVFTIAATLALFGTLIFIYALNLPISAF